MKRYEYKDGVKTEQYKSRNMWLELQPSVYRKVWSYDTYIGYINRKDRTFTTDAYGRYSPTTSKQITQLCNEMGLTLLKVDNLKH